mmetsp:Transcript_3113/g.9368  ORF Transcript_3113/g.9368 Transcript_3113/m.9368 type:complete len:216 (-) Transcript_3113:74-721(-)
MCAPPPDASAAGHFLASSVASRWPRETRLTKASASREIAARKSDPSSLPYDKAAARTPPDRRRRRRRLCHLKRPSTRCAVGWSLKSKHRYATRSVPFDTAAGRGAGSAEPWWSRSRDCAIAAFRRQAPDTGRTKVSKGSSTGPSPFKRRPESKRSSSATCSSRFSKSQPASCALKRCALACCASSLPGLRASARWKLFFAAENSPSCESARPRLL